MHLSIYLSIYIYIYIIYNNKKDVTDDSENPINIYMTVSTFSKIKSGVSGDGSVVVQKYDWTSLNPKKPIIRLSTNASLTCQYLIKPGYII